MRHPSFQAPVWGCWGGRDVLGVSGAGWGSAAGAGGTQCRELRMDDGGLSPQHALLGATRSLHCPSLEALGPCFFPRRLISEFRARKPVNGTK